MPKEGLLQRHRALTIAFVLAAVCGFVVSAFSGDRGLARRAKPTRRTIDVTERIRVRIPHGARDIRLWVPVARTGPAQEARLTGVQAAWPHELTADTEFDNRFVFFRAVRPPAGEQDIRVSYRVVRREQSVGENRRDDPVTPVFLEPRGLEIIDDTVTKISASVISGLDAPMDRARAIYLYVLSHVDYDKSGTGWGNGDVAYVCRFGKGNCTDFHSLFISLSRAARMPARFQIGYPVPRAGGGPIETAYHCWAEVHIAGRGWLPVDISEAWKQPAKADYYFGRLDQDRVLLSTGRNVILSPRQSGPPLNYIVRPYAEIDGAHWPGIEVERTYRDAAS